MAFQKSIEVKEYGITLPESYHKLQSIKIELGTLEYLIAVYASKELRESSPDKPITRKFGTIPYELVVAQEGDDIFAKTYTFIKNIPNGEYSTDTIDA